MTLQQEKEKISAELSEALSRVNSLEVSVCVGLIDCLLAGENNGVYLNKWGSEKLCKEKPFHCHSFSVDRSCSISEGVLLSGTLV
jgi:hypothetical protein